MTDDMIDRELMESGEASDAPSWTPAIAALPMPIDCSTGPCFGGHPDPTIPLVDGYPYMRLWDNRI